MKNNCLVFRIRGIFARVRIYYNHILELALIRLFFTTGIRYSAKCCIR
jgi:hypothetical protein